MSGSVTLSMAAVAAALSVSAAGQQPGVTSSYSMKVGLEPAEKTIRGTQRIVWTNTAGVPVGELRFHLYINAFRDRRSTLMREAGPSFQELWRDHEFGSVRFDALRLVTDSGDKDLLGNARHVWPDDDNRDDATVLRVPLPEAVVPGATIALESTFSTRLPKAYRRTGYVPGSGFYCMHWFPKLGVLQAREGEAVWNCHQFHANSEFFADFSKYDVEITVPRAFVVGATGLRQPDRASEDVAAGTRTEVFVAERVHDFAWVADPDFVRHDDEFMGIEASNDPVAAAVAGLRGVPTSTFDLPSTRIELLLRPEHDTEVQRRRHLEAVRCGLEFFGLRFGPYPYRKITVVDPGMDVLGRRLAGGMEYPMLITCGTALFPHPRQPRPEGVTVHEFGHQYWYGMSANNEFEEAWLDEGINTYSEGRAQLLHYADRMRPAETSSFGLLTVARVPGRMQIGWPAPSDGPLPLLDLLPAESRAWLDAVGFAGGVMPRSPLLELMRAQPTASFFAGVGFRDLWNDRRRLFSVDNPDAMVREGWRYLSRESYVANAYHRPATILRSLERMVGRDRWWNFLRTFHERSRFAHPTTADFTRLLAEMCGEGPAAYFDAASRACALLDYGVDAVRPPDGRGEAKEVIVRRYGTMSADVWVRFRFEGREQPLFRKVAAADPYPYVRFRFTDPASGPPLGRLVEVWVDPPEGNPDTVHPHEDYRHPAGVHLLDENLLNNAWRADADRGPTLYRGIRLLLQTQHRLAFAGLIG